MLSYVQLYDEFFFSLNRRFPNWEIFCGLRPNVDSHVHAQIENAHATGHQWAWK